MHWKPPKMFGKPTKSTCRAGKFKRHKDKDQQGSRPAIFVSYTQAIRASELEALPVPHFAV
jgi:hypothetical protein